MQVSAGNCILLLRNISKLAHECHKLQITMASAKTATHPMLLPMLVPDAEVHVAAA